MQSPIGHTILTENSSTANHTPGEVIEIVGSAGLKRYKYINFDNGADNVAALAGGVAFMMGSTNFDGSTVTMDLSSSKANNAIGVFQRVLTDGYYGWVQTWGQYSAVLTNGDDDIAAGDSVWAVGDGTVNSDAAGTAPKYKVVGWAISDDVNASNTVDTYLTLE